MDFAALAAPFPPAAVSWRVGSVTKDGTKGMALANTCPIVMCFGATPFIV